MKFDIGIYIWPKMYYLYDSQKDKEKARLKGINLNSVIVDEKIMQDNECWENKYKLYNDG